MQCRPASKCWKTRFKQQIFVINYTLNSSKGITGEVFDDQGGSRLHIEMLILKGFAPCGICIERTIFESALLCNIPNENK